MTICMEALDYDFDAYLYRTHVDRALVASGDNLHGDKDQGRF